MNPKLYFPILAAALLPLTGSAETKPFPFEMPREKPEMPLSTAMERLYENFDVPTYWWNELFSKFRYTPLQGFEYHSGDGTLTRRDPSKVIKANGKYYVWYTRRNTPNPPSGADRANDDTPSADWDLAEIWYATSEDGFTWKEEGVAIPRPAKPNVGWRSVCTPDVLFWRGKYYLYYQGFLAISGKRGDDCPVTASVADSPDGPWTHTHKIIIPNGPEGSWDQYSIHDPYPLAYNGRIYLYYKSDFNGNAQLIRAQGLAIGDDPLSPFEKYERNPVLNSGHETALFPFKGGIAAFASRHGNELESIQFAPDGKDFKVAANGSLLPIAAGPYVPDAFTDTKDGRGITWGLCHFTDIGPPGKRHSILGRFDCDLSQDHDDPYMKDPEHYWPPEFYFKSGVSKEGIQKLKQDAKRDLAK